MELTLSTFIMSTNQVFVGYKNVSKSFSPQRKTSRVVMNRDFLGSIVESSESGYINKELFVYWLNHLIKFVKPSQIEYFC